MHVYGKWSTGYKSGGANSRSLTYAPFNPETVSMFEIGAKTEFLDRHARLNVAAYTGSYKNIQLDFRPPISRSSTASCNHHPHHHRNGQRAGYGAREGRRGEFTLLRSPA
jgi:outer membrane receptor protein involved in Fe transport